MFLPVAAVYDLRRAQCLRHPRAEQERSDVRRPGDPCRDIEAAATVQKNCANGETLSPHSSPSAN
ncbi:protein of unknown function [Aminobacter niigataensis]|nr:protein of unknown function [Aminobacter niigataensis]